VLRPWLCLAVFVCGTCWGAAPDYSAESIVNTGNYTAGPFAPGSILSIFGTGLSYNTRAVAPEDIVSNTLPFELSNTRVYLDGVECALFYVSPMQINFMVPSKQIAGPATVTVVRQGVHGPEVSIMLANAAPALFVDAAGFVIATHGDNSLITEEAPAVSGEIIVIYATGLGKTRTNPDSGEIPQYISQIVALADLKVGIGGSVATGEQIKYAGLSPGSAGLYQINVAIPDKPGTDPELRVTIGTASTPTGVKLAAR
jgi:uncharacterized protein (TIGR03437 family)